MVNDNKNRILNKNGDPLEKENQLGESKSKRGKLVVKTKYVVILSLLFFGWLGLHWLKSSGVIETEQTDTNDTKKPAYETGHQALQFNQPMQAGSVDTITIPPPNDESRITQSAPEPTKEVQPTEKKHGAEFEDLEERMAAPLMVYSASQSSNIASVEVEAKRLLHPERTIVQGEILPATLETAITSELAGQVRAIVSEPVYGYTGNDVLIPAGSRLVGSYQRAGAATQQRIFITWNRVILPNGVSALINSPSSDRLGRSGQRADQRDGHFFQRFGQAILVSLISAGASTVGVGNSDDYNSLQAYRSSVSDSLADTATDILDENEDVKPTLRVYQGAKLNILVAQDIDFTRALKHMR